jgi:invasion protein IalB
MTQVKQTQGGRRSVSTFVAGLALLAVPLAAAAQAPQAQLPNGASNVSETYQDWQMVCSMQQEAKRCSVNQQQADSKTSQRVLAVELQPQGDKAEGVLAMPFGLLLDKGVTLKVGEADIGPTLRFRTCLPQGCLVPISLDAKALAALRKSNTLTVSAVSVADQPMSLSVSLKGFGQALDRVAALAR